MQIAVLGDAGCGKTSLIRSLVGLPFDADSPPTESKTTFKSPIGANSGEVATFIDCGPIADEHALTALLKGINCVILAYDCSSHVTFDSIRLLWLDVVKKCLEENVDVLLMLVGCKADLVPREVTIEEAESFAASVRIFFMETSARYHTQINLLLNVLRLRSPKNQNGIQPKSSLNIINDEALKKGTMLKIHRNGSVDLSSDSSGVNLHVSSNGTLTSTTPEKLLLKNNAETEYEGEIHSFPLLVDIKNKRGHIGTIIIESLKDDPVQLAEVFVKRYGLSREKVWELAELVKKRLQEYFFEPKFQRHYSSPHRSHSVNQHSLQKITQEPKEILARLNIPIDSVNTAIVAVREGDDVLRLVEAFRRTYDIPKGDLILQTLSQRIMEVLSRGKPLEQPNEVLPRRFKTMQTILTTPTIDPILNQEETLTARIANGSKQLYPEEPGGNYSSRQRRTFPKNSGRQYEALDFQEDSRQINSLSQSPGRQYDGLDFQEESRQRKPFPPNSGRQYEEIDFQEEEKHYQYDDFPETDGLQYDTGGEDDVGILEEDQKQPSNASSRQKRSFSSTSSPAYNNARSNQSHPPTVSKNSRVAPSNPPPPPPSRYAKKLPPPPTSKTKQSPIPTSTPSIGHRGRPLFYVDVNFGGKSDRIAVCKSDNLTEVAERFLESHKLPKTKTLKLTQLLEYHLKLHQKNRRHGS